MFRRTIILSVLIGFSLMIAQPALAQPDLGVPFTFDCILWKEKFDPLPDRLQRDILTAIGTVVFAGVVAVVDLKNMLGLPFDPKLVVIGFFGLGMAASLADYWFTNERIGELQLEGLEMECLDKIEF